MEAVYNNADFWNNLYEFGRQGWDIGYASPGICAYFEQLPHKNLRILFPGAGYGYEAECLYENGFGKIHVLDFAERACQTFLKRVPGFPEENMHIVDFFEHESKYDIIVEQTFFTAVSPDLRKDFVSKINDLLDKGGKYVGLFYNHEFGFDEPPFGAEKNEYLSLFESLFYIKTFEPAYNSIKPRAGRELFFIFEKKA